MAMPNKMGAMADDDLYSDGGMPDDGKDKSDDKPMDEQDDATEAVLPKAILAGKEFNVGDEVVLKITAMHDDQISVKYAPAKEEDGEAKDESGDDDGMKEKAAVPAGMGGGDSDYD
jgi:hypothetical protein